MPRVMNGWQDKLDRLKLSEVLIARLPPGSRELIRRALRLGSKKPADFLEAARRFDIVIAHEWGRSESMTAYLRHIHAIPREGGANGR